MADSKMETSFFSTTHNHVDKIQLPPLFVWYYNIDNWDVKQFQFGFQI